jgi:transcriptional regulator with XRE-family HTH domain
MNDQSKTTPARLGAGPLDVMGRRIRMLRAERGWSMRDLGARLGVSAMAVCKWERGEAMSSSHLMALARELGCTIEFLMGDWRRDVEVLGMCIDHAAQAGVISRSRAWELRRAFDLPGEHRA